MAEPSGPDKAQAPAAAATPEAHAAGKVVERVMLVPLASKESSRSRFSRAAPMAVTRRVRVLDPVAHKDEKGGEYLTFAVDASYGLFAREDAQWRKNVFLGCVYPRSGEVFLRTGADLRSSDYLLGKRVSPAPDHVCQEAAVVGAAPPVVVTAK